MKFKKKETLIDKIKSWWRYTKTYRIEIPYRDFKRGLQNIRKWFPIIWKDADWDHTYITTVLKFKIDNTAKYIAEKQRHIGFEDDVRYMQLASKLIDKIWGDNGYESEYYDYNKSDFNFIPDDKNILEAAKNKIGAIDRDGVINSILNDEEYTPIDTDSFEVEIPKDYEGNYILDIKQVSENFDEYFAKNKLMHKKAIIYIAQKNISTRDRKYTEAMIISQLKHVKAKELLFKILSEKIENWWD